MRFLSAPLHSKLRLVLCICAIVCFGHSSNAEGTNYTLYHKGIIAAEEDIFLKNDSVGGLKKFGRIFSEFSFAYVDDCIEAFQLALHFQREDYAMAFIKKALENGIKLHLLSLLSRSCPCDSYNKDARIGINASRGKVVS